MKLSTFFTLLFFSHATQAFVQLGRVDSIHDPLIQNHYIQKETLVIKHPKRVNFRPKIGSSLIRLQFSQAPVLINKVRLFTVDGELWDIDLLNQHETNSRLGDDDTFFIKLQAGKTLERFEIEMDSSPSARLKIDLIQTESELEFYSSL